MKKRVICIAESRGFCAGVIRAIDIVEKTLKIHGTPVFVRHDIVHNESVVESFKRSGVVFIEDLSDAAPGRPLIFSAHGVSPEIEAEADRLGLEYIDATCPIVKRIHEEAACLKRVGYFVVLIGHSDHPEIIGTVGHLGSAAVVVETPQEAENVTIPLELTQTTYLTQTTWSPDEVQEIVGILERKLPTLRPPSKSCVCYATLERQRAVRALAETCEVILVIGSPESSNSNRLREVAEKAGAEAYLIRSSNEIPTSVLNSFATVGVTAGASAPEFLVSEVVEKLKCGTV